MVIDSGGVGKNRLNTLSQDAASAGTRTKNAASTQTNAGTHTAKTVVGPQDSVSLSGTAKTLHRLEEKIHQSSSFNADKVAELKERITAGTYKPNPSAIAEKLMADF